jgi:hypothetical protein
VSTLRQRQLAFASIVEANVEKVAIAVSMLLMDNGEYHQMVVFNSADKGGS